MITKERIARVLIRIAALLLMLLLISSLLSCGGKKKVVEKNEEATEIIITDKEEKQSEKTEETKKVTDTKKEVTKDTDEEDFEAVIDDPTKPFEIEKETKEGKTTWRGKNIKNLNHNKKKIKEQTKDSTTAKEEKTVLEKEVSKNETTMTSTTKKKTTKKDLEVKRGFPWHWIILALLIYAIIAYLRKSVNPLKWF